MAHLSLSLLGAFQVERDGQPVTGFESIKVRALLAYLTVEADRPHRREVLAGLLWPELPDTVARTNLRQALANLREAIDDASATAPFLLITRDSIQFNPAGDHELDVTCFTALLAACATHAHRHLERCRSCAARMEQAITLYRGDFLAGFALGDSVPFEDWQLRHRERLHQRALDALAHLADYYERRGDEEHARHYAQRQIELDPWREEAHRQIMWLLARGGQRSAALAQYETCRRILACDLDVAPAAETTALYEQIRDQQTRRQGDKETSPHENVQPFSLSPSLLVSASSRHNFPAPTTPLIGRETELAQLGALLENPACRLITIVGPGGSGKTCLALAAAADQIDAFAHGVYFVSLAPLRSSEFLVPAIADALRLTFSGREDPRAQLLNYLRGKELLLVLDNFEHLVEGTALLVDILRRASAVTILVTSRERLNLQGEWVFDISGLQVPAADQTEGIEDYSAVVLFVQRARKVHARFTFGATEKRAVARICRLAEGMPLGIELAAAWVRTLSCAEIAHEIEQSLGFLTTSLRDVPERHRSLRAVFDHSWRLLSADERGVFRKLSVFRGGFGREAAEQVAGATLPQLAALVDKSLLRRNAAGRYELHELARQYVDEQLREAGEAEQTRGRHVAFFLQLVEAAEPQLHAPEQFVWLDRLEAERANLYAALEWLLHPQQGDTEHEAGMRLAGALLWFWWERGDFSAGRRWLEACLAYCSSALQRTSAQAKVLKGAGCLAGLQGDYALARARLQESARIWQELGDAAGVADIRTWLTIMALEQGDYATARPMAEESVALAQSSGDSWLHAHALFALGWAFRGLGDYVTARAHYEQSVRLFRSVGDKWGLGLAVLQLGITAYGQADYAAAQLLFEERLAIGRALGSKHFIAGSLGLLGNVALHTHDYGRAVALLEESLTLHKELGRNVGTAGCFIGLGAAAAAQGQPERAARLFGAAENLLEAIEARLAPVERAEYEHNVAAVRALLSEEAFAAAWAAGRAMMLDQAIAYALEGSAVDAEQPARAVAASIGSG